MLYPVELRDRDTANVAAVSVDPRIPGMVAPSGEKRARSALAFELSAESYRAAMLPEWMSQAPYR